jgi:hypothetical protein
MFLIVKEALLGLGKPYKTSVKQNKLPLIHLTCGCVVVCKNCSNAPSYSPCFCVCFAKIAPMPPHKALALVFVLHMVQNFQSFKLQTLLQTPLMNKVQRKDDDTSQTSHHLHHC